MIMRCFRCIVLGLFSLAVMSCGRHDCINESEWCFVNDTAATIAVTYGDGGFDSGDMDLSG